MKTLPPILMILFAAPLLRAAENAFPALIRAAEGRALVRWEGKKSVLKTGDRVGAWTVSDVQDGALWLNETAPRGVLPEKVLLKEGAAALKFTAQTPPAEESTRVEVLTTPAAGRGGSFAGEPPVKGKK